MSLRISGVPRARATALSLAVLASTATAVGLGPDSAAAPAADCAEAFPVAELVRDAPVHGLTVDSGTEPEAFSGTIIGVLDDGIAPGLDMVIADLTSPAIDAAGGIWQGMSGSPVYAEDGRLIGAVAYGLAWGGSPVAGITPFQEMDGYLGSAAAPPARVKVSERMAQRIAAESDATTAQAEQGFRQLPMPTGVSGVNLKRAGGMEKRAYTSGSTYRMNGSTSSATTPSIDTVVAGGNIAAALSLGDITAAGVGTATSVCGNRVVAFGHPMDFSGKTSMGLAAADALYVQEDPLGVPFKVANLGQLGGTITDDRLAGIAGDFGDAPTAVPFVSDVTYAANQRTGTTQVLVSDMLPAVAFYGNLANHDRVIDGIQGGSEVQTWTIKGTRADGSAFTVTYADRYQSTTDLALPGAFDLADVLDNLRRFSGVTITSITNDADVVDDDRAYRLVKVHQRTGGRWVDVTKTGAAVRAGRTLVLRGQLAASDGSVRYVKYTTAIPQRAAGRSGTLTVIGGNDNFDDYYQPQTIAALQALLAGKSRNDEVEFGLRIGSGPAKVVRRTVSSPLPRVVNGFREIGVVVR